MQKFQKWIFFISLAGIFVFGLQWKENIGLVHGQDYSAADVFWAMNDIRAAFGLEPYVMRDDLMQIAQGHAEYMAENQVLTHTRADGSQPNVTSENISLGPIQIAINTWMDDQPHKDTILVWSKGWAGAGVALAENGYVYICFDMIRMPDAQYKQIFDPYPPVATEDPNLPTLAPGEATRTPVPGINQYINEVVVATPDAEGYIWHEVKNGQTLWGIAKEYEVSEERIAGLNNLVSSNPTIYTGQKLLIDIVTPPAPTATMTNTPIPSLTPQASVTQTQKIATPYPSTKIPTQTAIVSGEQESDGSSGLLFSGGAVLFLAALGFIVYKKKWFNDIHSSK